jgi:hypothetical protein
MAVLIAWQGGQSGRETPMKSFPAFLAIAAVVSGAPAAAQSLGFNAGSTRKVQQLIGGSWPPTSSVGYCVPAGPTRVDVDWQTGAPLLNKTYSSGNLQVGGCDLGYSFEGQLKDERVLYFLCGDTLYFGAEDAVAVSRSTRPEKGLALKFLAEPSSGTAFLVGNHVSFDMTADNVPEAGVGIGDDNYVICATGHEIGGTTTKYTILTHFDGRSPRDANGLYGAWDQGRVISSNADGGHFIQVSLVKHDGHVYMFGTGGYRSSDIYLAEIDATPGVPFPDNGFWNGAGTRYFTGLVTNVVGKQGHVQKSVISPTWSTVETDPSVTPVVFDNPQVDGTPVCPPYPGDCPTAGNLSVDYVGSLGLWIMTFDGGRQQESGGDPNRLNGIYFSWAKEPWGPWSQPVQIFNLADDGGFGQFVYNGNASFGPTGGPEGPTIDPAKNDPCSTRGANYAPYIVKPFTQVKGNTLTLYYNLSTWNPYTIVLMSSTFTIGP